MSDESLLTVREVAELLGLSVGGVYHLISSRRIPTVKLSARCVRFDRIAVEDWIASLSVPADSIDPNRVRKQKSRGKKKENANES